MAAAGRTDDAPGGQPLFWRAEPAGRWTWCSADWTAYTGLSESASAGHG